MEVLSLELSVQAFSITTKLKDQTQMTCLRGESNLNITTNDEHHQYSSNRETRRERILENLRKTTKVREKQLKMMGKEKLSL